MTVSLGSLELGYVQNISYNYVQRLSNHDIPGARGAPIDLLGERPTSVNLSGELTGSSRFEYLRQLQRYRRIGDSLKFDCDMLKTIGSIGSVRLSRQNPSTLEYELEILISYFKQLTPCDASDTFSEESGGGTISLITSSPDPLEGTGTLKLSGTIAAATYSTIRYTPVDSIDLTDFDWLAAWYRTNNITNLTNAGIRVYDGTTWGEEEFHSELVAVDNWYRLRLFLEDFSNFSTIDWSEITALEVRQKHSSQQTFDIIVDDWGAFE